MSGGTNLVVPVVLWGKTAPTHCISSVFLARDQRTLVTGCYDGQICLWQVDPESLKMTPRCLLVGHTAPILCLANGSVAADKDVMVSSSENGEMCTWELEEGRCRETVKRAHVHTSMQPYVMSGTDDVRLFCNGFYAEVLVIDPFSLDVLLMLLSRVTPDWISALHVLRPAKRKDDVVLGLTLAGVVKVWTVAECHGESCHENESKQIRCSDALAMTCCAASQRTVLVVAPKLCQIYDAGDFSVLCAIPAPASARWQGGDFLGADRVILWADDAAARLYKLPANSVAESKEFHSKGKPDDKPFLYCTLAVPADKVLWCPPATRLWVGPGGPGGPGPLLLRGDCHGGVSLWRVPDVTPSQIRQIHQDETTAPLALAPTVRSSLAAAWAETKPAPAGILDQLDGAKLTASIYLPLQSRLVVGREDGSLVIVPASHTAMLQLLHGSHQSLTDWPPHQLLLGHAGPVSCLLYPHHCEPRYDKAHLVSGGVDFAVCLWDLYAGTLLHRFCVHAGEITQLSVPPADATPRVQKCVCAVSSDHAVTLLSLAERKCVVLASRHLFPVVQIKWRPLDDFMVVGCSDGTVYVWQMETGHLDRVLHGVAAQEVLAACDETAAAASATGVGSDAGLANPAVHFLRGLRHRNLSAIRHATQRGLHQLQQLSHHANADGSDPTKSRAYPLMIHGLRTNPKDPDAHILCFDIEALVVQLLSEEYAALSPGALESQGLIGQAEFQKVAALTQSASPDAHKKIADFFGRVKDKAGDMERILKEKDRHGILAKMKEGAENVQTKFQARAEGGGTRQATPESTREGLRVLESSASMEMTQLLLSLLHAWGLDADLDRVCETKLGLLRPRIPVSFGVLSKGGYMSLVLPTWAPEGWAPDPMEGPSERQERLARLFTSRTHWELSAALTSQHLLAVVALANTLMGMSNATFVTAQERNRKLHRQGSRLGGVGAGVGAEAEAREEQFTAQQAQIKQGWSLLATLHCVLLPDRVLSARFKKPQVELLATRWQHHCGEVREAAQALLLAELARLGPKGRRALVDAWAPYLPLYHTEPPAPTNAGPNAAPSAAPGEHDDEDDDDDAAAEELSVRQASSASDLRRRQTTAVVLLGVLGAEFGADSLDGAIAAPRVRRGSSVAAADANNLARLTSLALSHLVLAPASPRLAAHTALRRAAIDLIGRGFTVWEPFLEVSRVLLGLLELCCLGDALVPSMSYGLPLTPAHDSCRTSRHALTLIATARPAAFVTTMAREVARYNTLAQNAQALNVNLHQSVLHRAKPEILRAVELLIDKMQAEMADLLVEVVDVVLHCLDPGQLKLRPLAELFPPVCRFAQVSHCLGSRRVAAGSKTGTVTLYELRSGKCSVIAAHALPVSAVAFSPDGKFLATYCCTDNKLGLWQATTGMFGFGHAQTRCVKSYSTAPVADAARLNPLRVARLVWINNRSVALMLADGTETRFAV